MRQDFAGEGSPPDAALSPSEVPGASGVDDGQADAWAYAGYGARLRAAEHLARHSAEGIAALRLAIRDDRPAVRAVAARKLLSSPHADEGDVRQLVSLLDDGDWSVRASAGLSLSELASDPQSPLRPAAPHADDIVDRLGRGPRPSRADVRRIVAFALADGSQETAPLLLVRVPGFGEPIVALLRELLDAPEVRVDAMQALGRCGAFARGAVADLLPARYESHTEKREAARALLRLGCRLEEALPVLAEDPYSQASAEWRPFVPLLRRSLAGDGPTSWWNALFAVWRMGPDASDCIPEVLGLSGSIGRDWIIDALARMGSSAKPAVPWILAQLHGYDPPGSLRVPWTAFPTMSRLRYGPTENNWRVVLPKPADDCGPCTTASVVLRGLAEIAPGDPRVVREALARLADAEAPTREAATLALRHALAAGVIPPDRILARLAGDPNDSVRRTAASVLAFAARERGDVVHRLADLLERGDGASKEYAARALAEAGAHETLASALGSADVGARTWAAAALMLPPDPPERGLPDVCVDDREQPWGTQAIGIIEAAALSEDPAIRRIAVHVAGSCGWSWAGSVDLLRTAARDPQDEVRRAAEAFLADGLLYLPKEEWELPAFGRRGPQCEILRALHEGYLSDLHAEDRWLPVDLVELAEAGEIEAAAASRLLASIACDEALHPFERWCAERAR